MHRNSVTNLVQGMATRNVVKTTMVHALSQQKRTGWVVDGALVFDNISGMRSLM